MQFVHDPNLVRRHLEIIDRLFWRERRLPDVVLKESLSCRIFIEEALFSRLFFEKMKSFITTLGEERFYLAIILADPDPNLEGKSIPIIEVSVHDEKQKYLDLLHGYGNDSPYSAVGHIAQVSLIYSDSAKWGIHIDNHDLEIGVAGFADAELKSVFVSVYDGNYVFTAKEVVEVVVENVFINVPGGVPMDIRDQLIKNYPATC